MNYPHRPIALVHDRVSRDTEEALLQLLEMSRNERAPLCGLAFGGMIIGVEGRQCFTNATGEMYRSPLWSRGVVSDLHDALGLLARGITPPGWEP